MERAKTGQIKVCLEIRMFRRTRRAVGRAVRMAGAIALEEPLAQYSEEPVNWDGQVNLLAPLLQSQ